MPGGRPPKHETQEELEEAITAYFKSCEPQPVTIESDEGVIALTDKKGDPVFTNEKPPTTARLAHSLGYASRQSLYDLKQNDKFSYLIKRAILFIEGFHEERLGMNERVTGSIFWMKNHDWKDKQEIEHSVDDDAYDKLKDLYDSEKEK